MEDLATCVVQQLRMEDGPRANWLLCKGEETLASMFWYGIKPVVTDGRINYTVEICNHNNIEYRPWTPDSVHVFEKADDAAVFVCKAVEGLRKYNNTAQKERDYGNKLVLSVVDCVDNSKLIIQHDKGGINALNDNNVLFSWINDPKHLAALVESVGKMK